MSAAELHGCLRERVPDSGVQLAARLRELVSSFEGAVAEIGDAPATPTTPGCSSRANLSV